MYASGTQVPATTGFYAETALPIGSAGTPLIVSPTTSLPIWGSVNLSPITGLSNTITTGSGHATTLATSTGPLTSGHFANIANSNGDYGDSGISTNNLAVADSTVGDGGVWSSGAAGGYGYSSTVTITPARNVMYAHQLNLKWTQVIGNATVRVIGAGTSETLYMCLYNGAGTTLLWSASGAINTASTTVSLSNTQYTATPGVYMLAFEQTGSAAATLIGYGTTWDVFSIRLGKNTVRDATASPGVSGGVCPSSLTLTALTSANAANSDMMILLEP